MLRPTAAMAQSAFMSRFLLVLPALTVRVPQHQTPFYALQCSQYRHL
jgi:hypothetical protein